MPISSRGEKKRTSNLLYGCGVALGFLVACTASEGSEGLKTYIEITVVTGSVYIVSYPVVIVTVAAVHESSFKSSLKLVELEFVPY